MDTEMQEALKPPSFFERVRALLYPYKRRISIAIVWILVFQVLSLIEPYIFATVLDDLVHGGKGEVIAIKLAAAFVILLVLMFVKRVKDRRIRKIGNAIDAELNPHLLKKMMALPLSFHERENSGRLIGKVILGIAKLVDALYMVFHDFVPLMGQSLVAMAILAYIDYRSAILVFLTMCALGSVRLYYNVRLKDKRKVRHELGSDIVAHDSQCLQNVLTTQAFAQERREYEWSVAANGKFKDMTNHEQDTWERADLVSSLIVNVGRIGIITVSAYGMWHGVYGVGILAFTVGMAERLFASCYRIGGIYARATECIEPVSMLTEILLEPLTVADPIAACLPSACSESRGRVVFHDIHFRYPRQTASTGAGPDLYVPSLIIEEGKTIGIVGKTGSGKSTLAKLLLRFYDPQIGSVHVNDADVRDLKLADLRGQIGYVPQDVDMYDMTIGENIAYGRPSASKEEIEAAAKAADIHDFIVTREKGYDTLVGNKGMKISGGQRQKIGIARALLLTPPILVFDEATSSVDASSEREIQQTIDRVCTGRTAIIIAHRLSAIRRADRILVMHGGKVVEQGTHEALMHQNGAYAALVRAQDRAEHTESKVADRKLLN